MNVRRFLPIVFFLSVIGILAVKGGPASSRSQPEAFTTTTFYVH